MFFLATGTIPRHNETSCLHPGRQDPSQAPELCEVQGTGLTEDIPSTGTSLFSDKTKSHERGREDRQRKDQQMAQKIKSLAAIRACIVGRTSFCMGTL